MVDDHLDSKWLNLSNKFKDSYRTAIISRKVYKQLLKTKIMNIKGRLFPNCSVFSMLLKMLMGSKHGLKSHL